MVVLDAPPMLGALWFGFIGFRAYESKVWDVGLCSETPALGFRTYGFCCVEGSGTAGKPSLLGRKLHLELLYLVDAWGLRFRDIHLTSTWALQKTLISFSETKTAGHADVCSANVT